MLQDHPEPDKPEEEEWEGAVAKDKRKGKAEGDKAKGATAKKTAPQQQQQQQQQPRLLAFHHKHISLSLPTHAHTCRVHLCGGGGASPICLMVSSLCLQASEQPPGERQARGADSAPRAGPRQVCARHSRQGRPGAASQVRDGAKTHTCSPFYPRWHPSPSSPFPFFNSYVIFVLLRH